MVLASISMTIIIPVLIYAMQLAFSIVSGKKDSDLPDSEEEKVVVPKDDSYDPNGGDEGLTDSEDDNDSELNEEMNQ